MIQAHFTVSKEQYANAVLDISRKISKRPAFIFYKIMLMSTGVMALIAVVAGSFWLDVFWGEKVSFLYLGFCLVWAMALILSSTLYKQSIREIPCSDDLSVGQMQVSLSDEKLCIEKPGVIKTELSLPSIYQIEETQDSVLIYIDKYKAFCLDKSPLEEVGFIQALKAAIANSNRAR